MMNRRASSRPRRRIQVGEGRETDLQRSLGRREQRRTILVATNGECTEIAYFSALRYEPWISARIVPVVERGAPLSVVNGAARRRDRDDYDEAWAVCDVDQFITGEAELVASEKGVMIAWSNPCFEVWLLFHTGECGYVRDGKEAGRLLKRRVSDWHKTRLDFARFRDGIEAAITRAKAAGAAPDNNPSTGVWQLIEALK